MLVLDRGRTASPEAVLPSMRTYVGRQYRVRLSKRPRNVRNLSDPKHEPYEDCGEGMMERIPNSPTRHTICSAGQEKTRRAGFSQPG